MYSVVIGKRILSVLPFFQIFQLLQNPNMTIVRVPNNLQGMLSHNLKCLQLYFKKDCSYVPNVFNMPLYLGSRSVGNQCDQIWRYFGLWATF